MIWKWIVKATSLFDRFVYGHGPPICGSLHTSHINWQIPSNYTCLVCHNVTVLHTKPPFSRIHSFHPSVLPPPTLPRCQIMALAYIEVNAIVCCCCEHHQIEFMCCIYVALLATEISFSIFVDTFLLPRYWNAYTTVVGRCVYASVFVYYG